MTSSSANRKRMKRAGAVLALSVASSLLVIHAQQGPPPQQGPPLSVTPNVNVMSGAADQFVGDGFLQRQNEPVIAVSTLNPDILMAAANDYRAVDLALDQGVGESGQQASDSAVGGLARRAGKPVIVARKGQPRGKFPPAGATAAEAWMGVYFSYDRGKNWTTGLLPGFPEDTSADGLNSAIHGFEAATDPVMTSMTAGRIALGGVAFTRGGQSAVFVSMWRDIPVAEGKHQIKSEGTHIVVQLGSQSANGVFTDKPAIASDINRAVVRSGSVRPDLSGVLDLRRRDVERQFQNEVDVHAVDRLRKHLAEPVQDQREYEHQPGTRASRGPEHRSRLRDLAFVATQPDHDGEVHQRWSQLHGSGRHIQWSVCGIRPADRGHA